MTSRLDRTLGGRDENAAAGLQKRLEREYRAREQRKRTIMIVAALAAAGALLLGVSGVALATRVSVARGSEQATSAAAPVAVSPVAIADEPVDSADEDLGEASEAAVSAGLPAEKPEPEPEPAPEPEPETEPAVKEKPATQRFSIRIGDYGYEPSVIRASSKSPITLTVGKGEGCAAGFIIPSLGIQKDNSNSPVTFSLGRLDPGEYPFSCAMQMVEGTLVVE